MQLTAAGSGSDPKRLRLLSAFLAAAALLALRLPTNVVPILNVDEADFAVESGVLLDGGRPYIEFVEKKPPLIYLLYAGGLALVGRYNLPGLRLLMLAWVAASAWVLGAIARRLLGERAALLAVPGYAVAVSIGPPLDFHAANAETLFALPLLLGTWLCLPVDGDTPRAQRRRLLASGALIGIASLIKQQAGIQLLVLAAFVCMRASGPGAARRVASLVAGFAAPWLLAIATLARVGALAEFYYWTVTINRYYVANGNSLRDGLPLLAGATVVLAKCSPAVWVLAIAQLVRYAVRPRRASALLCLWFAGALIPISLGGRYFLHYFLQLLPPAVLLASDLAVEIWDRLHAHRLARVAVGAAFGLSVAVPAVRGMAPYRDREVLSIPHAMPSAREVARYVREHTSPDARVLVWGYGSALYFLAERQPATRFPYVTYLVGAVEGTSAWWSPFRPNEGLEIPRAWDLFFEDLERHPPAMVIDTSAPGYFAFTRFPPSRYPRLQSFLIANYQRTEVAGFPLWERKQ
ncbi:MAG TPA: glycosyltransferase family 39 protein [Myxococcales bacterium]|nr:glycosyltransferase family 39 protein [Myxococcales bacterium]